MASRAPHLGLHIDLACWYCQRIATYAYMHVEELNIQRVVSLARRHRRMDLCLSTCQDLSQQCCDSTSRLSQGCTRDAIIDGWTPIHYAQLCKSCQNSPHLWCPLNPPRDRWRPCIQWRCIQEVVADVYSRWGPAASQPGRGTVLRRSPSSHVGIP